MCVHDADLRHHQRAARALALAVAAKCERRFERTTGPDLGVSTGHWPVGIGGRAGSSPIPTRGFFGRVVLRVRRECCLPLRCA
eukprot:365072-Chlamydomonas_euryale.AAC.9